MGVHTSVAPQPTPIHPLDLRQGNVTRPALGLTPYLGEFGPLTGGLFSRSPGVTPTKPVKSRDTPKSYKTRMNTGEQISRNVA